MQLLHAFVAAAAVAAMATSEPSDDRACSLSDDNGQVQGHHSMIHRQSILGLSSEGKSDSEAFLALESHEAHRKSLDEFVLQLSGKKHVDVHEDMKQLNDFLFKQGFAITEGHTDELDLSLKKQTDYYDQWTQAWSLNTICETGFNAGHSALRFLSQTVAQVYEFDMCDHNYAQPASLYLYGKYPGRLHLTCGDSKVSLPQFRKTYPDLKCDIIIIDGGHDPVTAGADLFNLAKMANARAAVAIDDTPCTSAWCDGPNKAWAQFIADGCIANETKIPMGPTGKERGFSFGFLQPCARLQQDTFLSPPRV
mmetsp:Transcript_147113/g.256737  ORF Transcript_147113/g.256737 Transcript_147113/m.256737 type:complete len:309 (-) Transcript_147113:30-956(-)